MDNHGSHLTWDFLEFCEKHHIIAFCFPPHTTHLLQPLDGKDFQVYKHFYRKNNNAMVQWGGSVKEKRDFMRDIYGIRLQAFKDRTIRSSFADRGIYPFKPKVVLDPLKEALPSIPVLKIHESTPPLSSSATNSPPQTVQKLRRYVRKVKDGLEKIEEQLDIISPKMTKRLGHIFEGSLVQAELNAQREDDIQRILRNREHLKVKKTKRRVNIGGPLSIKDANRRIEARDAEEIQKQWRRVRKLPVPQVADTASTGTNAVQISGSSTGDDFIATEEVNGLHFYMDSTGRR